MRGAEILPHISQLPARQGFHETHRVYRMGKPQCSSFHVKGDLTVARAFQAEFE